MIYRSTQFLTNHWQSTLNLVARETFQLVKRGPDTKLYTERYVRMTYFLRSDRVQVVGLFSYEFLMQWNRDASSYRNISRLISVGYGASRNILNVSPSCSSLFRRNTQLQKALHSFRHPDGGRMESTRRRYIRDYKSPYQPLVGFSRRKCNSRSGPRS